MAARIRVVEGERVGAVSGSLGRVFFSFWLQVLNVEGLGLSLTTVYGYLLGRDGRSAVLCSGHYYYSTVAVRTAHTSDEYRKNDNMGRKPLLLSTASRSINA